MNRTSPRAFTLIELMAVVLVVLVLAAIGMGVAGFVQRKVAIATTKAQIAMIEAAVEAYKSDWGYYPPTLPGRNSRTHVVESANGNTLYRALFLKGNVYLRGFPASQIRVKTAWGTTSGVVQTNLCDVWGSPFVYYCSPTTPFSINPSSICVCYDPGMAYGGQVNRATFDLLSYGPDQSTYIPGAFVWGATAPNGSWSDTHTNIASAIDDISNWKQ